MHLELSGEGLSVSDAWELMHSPTRKVTIASKSREKMKASRARVESVLDGDEAIYGINTGFGSLANVQVKREDLETLQENLIRSHCVGVGDLLTDSIVRGAMLLRANTLCQGYSGIRLETVDLLLDCLNHDILPLVPDTGSLGASGDLAPLAHMALTLLGEGEVRFKGQLMTAAEALRECRLKPVRLGAKEGLALINGTPVMCALAVEVLKRCENLLKVSDIASMMSLEALHGTNRAFIDRLHQLRPHRGQKLSARNLFRLLENSPNRASHKDCSRVQDAYSLRCIPQVHGSCYDAFFRTLETIEIEMNSVTDNPIVLEDEIISGGHFHGEPVSMVLCYLAMGLVELGSISERRQNRLVNHNLSNLPPFLVRDSGLNSGWMIAHYTSAACVSESKVLAHPAVVDSIPTSADQEDHVSMGLSSAKNCLQILEKLESVLSIELLIATQGLDFHEQPPGPALKRVMEVVREKVDFLESDRYLKNDIEAARTLIREGKIVEVVEEEIGDLLK